VNQGNALLVAVIVVLLVSGAFWAVLEYAPEGSAWHLLPYVGGPFLGAYWFYRWTEELATEPERQEHRTAFYGLFYFVFAFAFLAVAFAAGFMAAAKLGHSVVGREGHCVATFSEFAYFSVVTGSTLGYGDLRPLGLARLLACCQVVEFWLFLAVAGLLVHRTTSPIRR